MTGYVELEQARWDLEVATGQTVAGTGVEARMREARAAAGRLAAGLPGLLDELEQLRRPQRRPLTGLATVVAELRTGLSAELADARAQRDVELAHCQALGARVEREVRRAVAAERALEAVRAIAQKWACDHVGFDEITAALSAASPTTSDEPARCLHGNAAVQTYACGCEPARCPHGELEPHPDGPDPAVDWCDGPGPAASGTPDGEPVDCWPGSDR